MLKNEPMGNRYYWMAEWRGLGGTWEEKKSL